MPGLGGPEPLLFLLIRAVGHSIGHRIHHTKTAHEQPSLAQALGAEPCCPQKSSLRNEN